MLPFVKGLLTGMAFGVVLYKVGAVRYSRVMGMLTLRDTKIMKFAFTAIATAALLYGLAAVTGVAEPWGLTPRVKPYMGLAHRVGGVMVGGALGLTGLCPGTCMTKAGGRTGEHKFAALAAVVGLVAGVILYSAFKEQLVSVGIISAHQLPLTLPGVLGLPYGPVALVFGAAVFGIVVAIDRLTPERSLEPERKGLLDHVRGEWSWMAGGMIGGSLVVLATAQDGYLGFSGALLASVGWAAQLVGMPLEAVPAMSDDLVWRAALFLGTVPGGLLARAFSLPSAAEAAAPVQKVLYLPALGRSFASGLVLSAGAMIGGGCTTGAFISAWPTLSLGSFAMAGTFFVVSMAVGNARLALRKLDLPAAQLSGDRVYD